jgi:hypothetical protein
VTTTGQPDGASWREWSEWWAHRTAWAWVAALGIGLDIIWLAWPTWVWTVVFTSVVVVLTLNLIHHDMSVCSRCLAKMPADPKRAVRRHRWALWLHHHRPLIYVVWFGMWLARDNVSQVVQALSVLSIFVGLVLLTTVELLHRPLQLWCPRCPRRGWGGGGGEDHTTPTPRPTPVGEKRS